MIPLFFFFRLFLIFTGCKFPITTTTWLPLLHNYLLHTQIRTYVTYVQMPREHTTSRGVLTPSRRLAGSGTRIHHAIHTGTDPVISLPPPFYHSGIGDRSPSSIVFALSVYITTYIVGNATYGGWHPPSSGIAKQPYLLGDGESCTDSRRQHFGFGARETHLFFLSSGYITAGLRRTCME